MTIEVHAEMAPVTFGTPTLIVVESLTLTAVVPDYVRELRVRRYQGGWELQSLTLGGRWHCHAQARAVHTLDDNLWPARWPSLPTPWPHPAFSR